MTVYVDPQQREWQEKRKTLADLNHCNSSFGAWKAAQDVRSASVRAADGQVGLSRCHGPSWGKVGRPDAKNGGV